MRGKSLVVMTIAVVLAGVAALQFAAPQVLRGRPAPDRTIEIGIETTSGTAGDAVLDGAEFAITRAGALGGFRLKFVPYDDYEQGVYSADQGSLNVDDMVERQRLLGIVGPVFSPVAAAMIPDANKAHLAIVSPTTSVQCLTLSAYFCPDRWTNSVLRPTGKNNYFRIAADERFRGAAMADFAYSSLGVRKVAVWSDQLPFWGMAAADAFSFEFARKGGSVVTRGDFDFSISPANAPNRVLNPDFRAWLVQAGHAGVDAVYGGSGGDSPDCAAWGQASQGAFGPTTFFLGADSGPDPTVDPGGAPEGQCLADASAIAAGRIYASSDIADARLNPGASSIVAAFERFKAGVLYDPNIFAGYDCAAILIAAIRRAIDHNHGLRPTRQQVVDQLYSMKNFRGVTGTYTFDATGDPTSPTVAIMQFVNGAWVATRNVTTES